MALKDAIELEGTVVELLPNTMFRVEIPGRRRVLAYLRQNASAFHSHLARRQSYARGLSLRFVEGADHFPPKVTARILLRVSYFADYESTTISKKTLCELQDCEAQERLARDLQKPAAQATPGLNGFSFVTL